jgi:maleylpyruvate isomerase
VPALTALNRLHPASRSADDHYRWSMTAPTASAAEQLETVRLLVAQATHRMLGDTIGVSDEDWRRPSRLPDWTRAHVATHLARQADGIGRLTHWARTGERQDMYSSADQRESDIEAGAGRTGLELQVDLDTSAGRLAQAFDALDQADAWDAVVEMRGGMQVPARLLPLARLLEVVIHHVDLDVGFDVGDIDQQTAEWLLEWCAFRLRGRDEFPRLVLTSDSGFTIHLGSSGEPRPVTGSSSSLLGWLMNRVDSSAVDGGDELHLPAF